MAVIRKDAKGLFVKCDGLVARPGDVSGYAHALRMDDAGVHEGQHVKAHHVSQTQLVKLTTPNGIVHWFGEDRYA